MGRPGVGNPGNRGGIGGARKAPEMVAFYEKLDAACLHAVDYLAAVVIKAKEFPEDREWRQDGINAAGKLIVKAPERIDGNLSGSLVITWNDDQAIQPEAVAKGDSQ